jgi:hypothetical protein
MTSILILTDDEPLTPARVKNAELVLVFSPDGTIRLERDHQRLLGNPQTVGEVSLSAVLSLLQRAVVNAPVLQAAVGVDLPRKTSSPRLTYERSFRNQPRGAERTFGESE